MVGGGVCGTDWPDEVWATKLEGLVGRQYAIPHGYRGTSSRPAFRSICSAQLSSLMRKESVGCDRSRVGLRSVIAGLAGTNPGQDYTFSSFFFYFPSFFLFVLIRPILTGVWGGLSNILGLSTESACRQRYPTSIFQRTSLIFIITHVESYIYIYIYIYRARPRAHTPEHLSILMRHDHSLENVERI